MMSHHHENHKQWPMGLCSYRSPLTRVAAVNGTRRKIERGEAGRESQSRAHLYAQRWIICQLLEDGELGLRNIGEGFLLFFKRTRMGNRDRELLELLLPSHSIDISIYVTATEPNSTYMSLSHNQYPNFINKFI